MDVEGRGKQREKIKEVRLDSPTSIWYNKMLLYPCETMGLVPHAQLQFTMWLRKRQGAKGENGQRNRACEKTE